MTAVQAGVYCRISRASDGDTTKTDDQERLCREVAERRGWAVADEHVYTDGSKSAWQRNRKRPGWDRMLADVEAGKITAIVVYHGDRLVRQPYDLELLINLAYGKGIKLASPTGGRDLANEDDLFILRIEAAAACRESSSISRRKKAQYERYRREGRVRPGGPGGRSFGFETDNLTPRTSEFDEVTAAADRVLAGESVHSVVREWNGRGLTTTGGHPWRTQTLGGMLCNPRYTGLMPDGESKAAWPAAIKRDKWERLRMVIEARGAFTNPAPTNARKWLLSGIATCGPCGAPLQIGQSAGGRAYSYTCAKTGCGKIRRNAAHLDAYTWERVISRLNNPLNPEGHAAPADHSAEWSALGLERAETEALVSDFGASPGRARLLLTRLDQIDARMAELRDLAGSDTRTRLIEQYRGLGYEEGEKLPLDVRRALVSACVTVTVLPVSGYGPGFRPQDVQVLPVELVAVS